MHPPWYRCWRHGVIVASVAASVQAFAGCQLQVYASLHPPPQHLYMAGLIVVRCACWVQSKLVDMRDWEEKARLRLRLSAIECWFESKKEIGLAVRLFKNRNPNLHPGMNYARFIRNWVDNLTKHFDLYPHYGEGRPVKLPVEAAQRAVELLWDGHVVEGKKRYFRSIAQAVALKPELKAITKKYDIKPATLLRHMKDVEGDVRLRLEVVKRCLTDDNKAQRLKSSKQLMLWPLERLRRTFWIDAATIYIVPKSQRVYAPPDAHMVETDDRMPNHSSQLQKLRFYVCINAILGPVAIKFITGTTGLHTEEEWLVRHCLHGTPAVGWGGSRGRGVLLHSALCRVRG